MAEQVYPTMVQVWSDGMIEALIGHCIRAEGHSPRYGFCWWKNKDNGVFPDSGSSSLPGYVYTQPVHSQGDRGEWGFGLEFNKSRGILTLLWIRLGEREARMGCFQIQ